MGVSITISGKLPENPVVLQLLLIALRECLTNTVNHAKGTQLFLTVSLNRGIVKAVYRNNGKAPEDEIVEGGGLSSLREKIEQAGGTMRLQSVPDFELIIELSEKEIELW